MKLFVEVDCSLPEVPSYVYLSTDGEQETVSGLFPERVTVHPHSRLPSGTHVPTDGDENVELSLH